MTCFSAKLWSSVVAASSAELKIQGDTLSLELSGQNDWTYDLKRSNEKGQTKVVLTVKGLAKENFEKIQSTKNPFIKSVKVVPNGADGKKQIEFILASDKVETFDYLTDFPSKLIVDFYVNETMQATIEKEVKASRIPASLKADSKAKKSSMKRAERKPAEAEFFSVADFPQGDLDEGRQVDLKAGLFNVSDNQLSRFQITASQINPNPSSNLTEFFMAYPLLEQPYSFWTKMKSNFPDYEIQPENTEENKQIRLIQKLYNKKRPLVLRKTTEWFAAKYPNSKYLEVAYGMTADLHAKEWLATNKSEDFDYAQFYYGKLLEKSNHSALYERTSLFTGFLDLDKKNYLSALRKFKAHYENEQFKNSSSKHYAELGMANCLAKLNKVDDAIKMIENAEKNVEDPLLKAEAAYRKADYLMNQEKFLDAKNQYEDAQKKYPQFAGLFPNGYFNKMEALFHLKLNVDSHVAALEFIKRYPLHDQAPYALTRLGELLEILGAPQEKSVGAYLETHFRYGDSPKTIVARLHLLSARMKGMKENEMAKTIEKMNELAKKSDLQNIEQFKTTMISDGYARRKDFPKAIETLVKYNQESPAIKNADPVVDRIKNNIYSYIQNLSETNKHREVLKIHKQYADNWIRKQERADTFYYLGRAYQSAGAYEAALNKYKQSENMLLSPNRSPAAIQIAAVSGAPKMEEVYLAQAQALAEQNDFQNAEVALDKIKNPESLSTADQIARVNVASLLYQRKGDNSTAIRYLSEVVRVWKAEPNLVTDSAVRVAKLYGKTDKPQTGIDLLDSLLQEKVSNENARLIQKAKSEIAMDGKLWDVAIKSLTYILNNPLMAEKKGQGEEKYQLGDLYFQRGEMKKAEDTWASLSEGDDPLWSKLADEKMKSAKWQDDYKKYIKRIPAAAGDIVNAK